MKSDIIQNAGPVVARLREKHGLTVEELAKKMGYDAERLAKIEAGEEAVGIEIVHDLATALSMRQEFLILHFAMAR